MYFILLTSLNSTKYAWIRIWFIGSGFRGGDASTKGKQIRLVLAPKWRLLWMEQIQFLWTQLLDPFVEQGAQISTSGYHYVVKSGQYLISHMQYNHLYGYYSFLHLHLNNLAGKLQVDGHLKLQVGGPKVTSL